MTTLLALLACTGEEPVKPPGPTDSSPTDSGEAPDWLQSPAEAEDLDPDPELLHLRLLAAPQVFNLEDGTVVDGFAYNGQVPGPTLRAKVGDRLRVELENGLDTPTTLHWHGLHVPYEMDGSGWIEGPVPAGGSQVYEFTLEQAGTFWYHPHFDTDRQVDLGLYGALIVEDPADPELPDLVLIFDTWGEYAESDDEAAHSHGYEVKGGGWRVNLREDPPVRLEQPLRARIVNASNIGYLALSGPELLQVGSDQGLWPAPVEAERVVLGPGDRAELLLTGAQAVSLVTEGYNLAGPAPLLEDQPLLELHPVGVVSRPDWPSAAVPPGADPGYTDIVYVLSGGEHSGEWMINGERFPDITPEQLALGTDAVIEVRNLSPTRHPFHMHGYVFEVLSVGGVPPAQQTLEDTLDLGVHEVARLRIVANNPGWWMVHCHLLPHAHEGMMTVLEVN